MKQITAQELVEILKTTNVDEIGLETITPVKMNKKKNPLYEKKVERHTKGTFAFGNSYTERVNESLENASSEEVYQTKTLPWGEWVSGAENKVIQYTKKDEDDNSITNFYLRYYNAKNTDILEYLVDGVKATTEESQTISQFLPKKKYVVSKTQSELGLNESNYVAVQMVSFSNIVSIAIGDEEYCIN